MAEARWVPWREFTLTDLRLRSPNGGRFHVVGVRVTMDPGSLLTGRLTTRWRFSEVRVDPSSWGIHRPLAQEILSAGPVTTQGSGLLLVDLETFQLQALTLEGPILRLFAKGWMDRRQKIDVILKGAVTRRLLEGIGLMSSSESLDPSSWEPFELNLRGGLTAPEVSFSSHFISFSQKNQRLY